MIDLDEMRRVAEREIRAAFPVGAVPSEADMENDHCPECRETVARFSGKPWPDLALDDLRGNPEPAVLTASGFRHYLPAMMLLSLQSPRELDCFPGSLIGELSPRGTSLSAEDVDRLAFTREQSAAILAYLRFFEIFIKLDWSGPGWPDDAILAVPNDRPLERALRYWTTRASEDAG